MQGKAYVFINFKQAASFGHIGWGFQVDEQRCYFGSADHLWDRGRSFADLIAWAHYARVVPGGNMDWWAQMGSFDEMMEMMRRGPHIKYHSYKCVTVDDAKPENALQKADEVSKGGWAVLTNNCIHQAFHILKTYGVGREVPNPQTGVLIRISKVWFGSIEAEAQHL